jgi:hypothetical protein
MSDKLIEEGMKQPDQIKITFEKKEQRILQDTLRLTRHTPQFQVKDFDGLLDAKKDNGPTLFNLMGQCFQDVGLTEWTNIVTKQCPTKADCTDTDSNECIRDYLKADASSQMLATS